MQDKPKVIHFRHIFRLLADFVNNLDGHLIMQRQHWFSLHFISNGLLIFLGREAKTVFCLRFKGCFIYDYIINNMHRVLLPLNSIYT